MMYSSVQLLNSITMLLLTWGFSPQTANRPRNVSLRRVSSTLNLSFVHNKSPSAVDVLDSSGYGARIIQLGKNDESRIVEVFINGETTLAHLVEISSGSTISDDGASQTSPRVEVTRFFPEESKETVDLGQITTIWPALESRILTPSLSLYQEALQLVDKYRSNPIGLDKLLDKLYSRFVRQGRNDTRKLPKDDRISSISKKLQKVGPAYCRLVDSSLLAECFTSRDKVLARTVAALLLSMDAKEGGRFKRWSCLLVSQDNDVFNVVNGGWLALDQGVRASTEARKLVGRSTSNLQSGTSVADRRILQRLECLAMGEVLGNDKGEEVKLEKDVRETLRAMDLPFSASGACQALVNIGHWSQSTANKLKQAVEPWSPQILKAASWYAHLNWQNFGEDDTRSDLRQWPCVCVDAKTTSFRDDAMSVRPRAITGRTVNKDASKWEILIHITDISDIYVPSCATIPDPEGHLLTLQRAAESRGVSRYDLPLGPLHLLPPTVLHKLSFSKDLPHRCLTLWVYIDERDGKLLDAGIERSLVGPSTQLSYVEASTIMEGSGKNLTEDTMRMRSLLLVIERNLKLWKDRRLQESEQVRKRESRMASRELPTSQLAIDANEDRRDSFHRTRGHQLVDACLEMYGFACSRLLQKAGVPFPTATGAEVSRGGRLGTAPLRRYIDGQGQRQILASLCSHGELMTLEECRAAGRLANNARNAVANVRARR